MPRFGFCCRFVYPGLFGFSCLLGMAAIVGPDGGGCCFAQVDRGDPNQRGDKSKFPTAAELRAVRPILTPRTKNINTRAGTLAGSLMSTSRTPKGVGAPITDREAWKTLGKSEPFQGIVEEAMKLSEEPIPLPTPVDYMRYYGSAVLSPDERNNDYEQKYERRRYRLERLVLAECIEDKGRFLADIEKTIQVLCGEPTWSTPAEDPGALKFKGESAITDYRIARTAWNLATADYWLGRKLSQPVRDLIRESVEARFLLWYEAGIKLDDYTFIPWADSESFRNADCHACVLGCAFALVEQVERRAVFMAASLINVENFVGTFHKDGYCPEGIHAWNEGFSALILIAEVAYQGTGGRTDMYIRSLFREAALFGLRMEIAPGVYEVVGDRRRGDRPITWPVAFASKRLGLGLEKLENEAPFFGVGPGPLYRVGVCCFPNSATQPDAKPTRAQTVKLPLETLRTEFPQTGIIILRPGSSRNGKQMAVQIKGGGNDDVGNHSDIGSYAITLQGSVPLCELGARFNRDGLKIEDPQLSNLVNSFGHPVPKIDGKLQKNGKGAYASLETYEKSNEVDTVKLDMIEAYEWANPKDVRDLTRTFIYARTGGKDVKNAGPATLTVVDTMRTRKYFSFENSLITFGPYKVVKESEDHSLYELVIGEGPQAIHVTVTNESREANVELRKTEKVAVPMIFEAGQIDEPMPHEKRKPFRLSFAFQHPVNEITMTTTIRPAVAAEQELAKNDPGPAMRIYTSPIDAQEVATPDLIAGMKMEGMEGFPGGMPPGGMPLGFRPPDPMENMDERLRAGLEGLKKTSPEAVSELKKLSDEEIKAMLPFFMQELTEEHYDAFIALLRKEM